MTPAEVLAAARAAGVTLWVDGETLRYRGPREALTADLLNQLKAHKPAIVAELEPDFIWTRVTITEPGGRVTEIETDGGWDLAEWQANAERRHGPGCSVTPIAGYPPVRAPDYLKAALAKACDDMGGISRAGLFRILELENAQKRDTRIGEGRVFEGQFSVLPKPPPPPAIARPDPPLSCASEARRRKVSAMLARDGVQYAVLVEDPNTDPVTLVAGTRDGVREVLIPRDQFDPFAVVERVHRWDTGGAVP